MLPDKYCNIEKVRDTMRKKDWWKSRRDKGLHHLYYTKHYPWVRGYMIKHSGESWDIVYSNICKKVPNVLKDFVKDHIKFENYSIWVEYFYVKNGILYYKPKQRNVFKNYYKKRKVNKKLDIDYSKLDYDLEMTKLSETSDLNIFINNSRRLNIETSPGRITYFTIQEFVEWAQRHQKTYRIRIYCYIGLAKILEKELIKYKYDR